MELGIEIKRFKEIRDENQFTQAEFAERLGVKNTTADIERGRTKLSGTVVMELLKQFNINPLWLYGQSHQKYLPLHQVDTMPKVITVDVEDNENITMVNQKAAAGYPHNIQDVDWYRQLPAFDFPLPQYRNATYRGFQVEGDSMMPNLRPEDWVLAKAIPSLSDASDHKIYVVVMYDTVVVKKLHKLADPSKIRLISLNEEYAPFEVKVSDIQELWQVTSKLTFSLDANSENSMLRQLQASMEELKSQLNSFKR
ncbi:LexA family transcriptional regulator [Mesonia sp.]|uniref:LexA family transcriptional regulator n=1 Tax=Mesonia sp. TaxID=1960830 RepID=UPI001769A1DA|nr:LexA family transcriptional regulator [Mesonia sp.]HIB36387.1 LexA family transcriptional regulator [Mesonia sp.]HIO28056.1 LexA family transcriptional regulator [Flavobacteriaceae bacterium]